MNLNPIQTGALIGFAAFGAIGAATGAIAGKVMKGAEKSSVTTSTLEAKMAEPHVSSKAAHSKPGLLASRWGALPSCPKNISFSSVARSIAQAADKTFSSAFKHVNDNKTDLATVHKEIKTPEEQVATYKEKNEEINDLIVATPNQNSTELAEEPKASKESQAALAQINKETSASDLKADTNFYNELDKFFDTESNANEGMSASKLIDTNKETKATLSEESANSDDLDQLMAELENISTSISENPKAAINKRGQESKLKEEEKLVLNNSLDDSKKFFSSKYKSQNESLMDSSIQLGMNLPLGEAKATLSEKSVNLSSWLNHTKTKSNPEEGFNVNERLNQIKQGFEGKNLEKYIEDNYGQSSDIIKQKELSSIASLNEHILTNLSERELYILSNPEDANISNKDKHDVYKHCIILRDEYRAKQPSTEEPVEKGWLKRKLNL